MSNVHTTGDYSAASTTCVRSPASTTGGDSPASTTGIRSVAMTTGYLSPASATGGDSAASTTGVRSHAFAADGAAESRHAVAVGRWVRLTPTSCAAVVLPENSDMYDPTIVSKNDGWTVGVWITAENGQIVERPDVLLPDDGRGYQLTYTGGRYRAGCRSFTAEQAIAHWSNPQHLAPASAARLLAEVETHIARTEGEL